MRPMLAGPRPGGETLGGELDGSDRDRAGFAGALEAKIDRPADDIADETSRPAAHALERGAVSPHHDGAAAHAGRGGRPRLEQLDDLEPTLSAEARGDGLAERPRPADDAEERAADPAVDDQAVEDGARRCVDRDSQPETDPGDRGVDADDAAARVRKRPARVAGVECCVSLADVLDEPARAPVATTSWPTRNRSA